MSTSRSLCIALVALLCLSALPQEADAQRRGTRIRITTERADDRDRFRDRDLTLAVGVLDYDRADDNDLAPMAAIRAEWGVRRWVRTELGVSYALADVSRPDLGAGETSNSSLATATLGVKAELPTDVIRPYVGIAGGLFGRWDGDDGEDFVRPTIAVPAGVRLLIGQASLRLEARWRWDEHEDGLSVPSREFTAGLGFRF